MRTEFLKGYLFFFPSLWTNRYEFDLKKRGTWRTGSYGAGS